LLSRSLLLAAPAALGGEQAVDLNFDLMPLRCCVCYVEKPVRRQQTAYISLFSEIRAILSPLPQ
jgi:hypothetical protein